MEIFEQYVHADVKRFSYWQSHDIFINAVVELILFRLFDFRSSYADVDWEKTENESKS